MQAETEESNQLPAQNSDLAIVESDSKAFADITKDFAKENQEIINDNSLFSNFANFKPTNKESPTVSLTL